MKVGVVPAWSLGGCHTPQGGQNWEVSSFEGANEQWSTITEQKPRLKRHELETLVTNNTVDPQRCEKLLDLKTKSVF